ncbi:MAG: peptidase M10, partial [Chitinophagales bacterium]|nr:peptidase M10 [Chitinophagales bacterium]
MGEIEIINDTKNIYIHANMIVYGNEADESIAKYIAEEIGEMWSEPKGKILLDNEVYTLSFMTTWQYEPELNRDDIIYNNNPRNNYFRIEEYSKIQISMVDDLG